MRAMNLSEFNNSRLRTIAEKVLAGTPISGDDALYILGTTDILELGRIASHIKSAIHGTTVFYGVNMNLNYTNVCELRCPLCAYSCDEGDASAFTLSLEEIAERVRRSAGRGIDEVHIVGGLNPSIELDYYLNILKTIKSINPDIFIVAFTAVEYDYFSRKFAIPLKDLFERFKEAGLGALPGGGAEIFSPHIRGSIAPDKIPGTRWLEVMETAHRMGLRTNATMLYNHIENNADIVDHLTRIRDLQDRTGGFKTFVPLPFHGQNTTLENTRAGTGLNDIRVYAASRIFLSNIPHLKALWMYLGEKMAQVLLHFGVDDFGATYDNEKVVHAAGAETPDYGSEQHLRRLIENAGMVPVRTNAGYTPIK